MRLAVQLEADRRRRARRRASANSARPERGSSDRRRCGARRRLWHVTSTELDLSSSASISRSTTLFGQRRVAELGGELLAVGQRPLHEVHHDLRLRLVLRVLVEEEPGERRDRIDALARRVGDRDAEVRRACLPRPRPRPRVTDSRLGAHELAGHVLDRAVGDLVLERVDQLDVADRAGRLLDEPGDALVALAADADRPVDRRRRRRPSSSTPARPWRGSRPRCRSCPSRRSGARR